MHSRMLSSDIVCPDRMERERLDQVPDEQTGIVSDGSTEMFNQLCLSFDFLFEDGDGHIVGLVEGHKL